MLRYHSTSFYWRWLWKEQCPNAKVFALQVFFHLYEFVVLKYSMLLTAFWSSSTGKHKLSKRQIAPIWSPLDHGPSMPKPTLSPTRVTNLFLIICHKFLSKKVFQFLYHKEIILRTPVWLGPVVNRSGNWIFIKCTPTLTTEFGMPMLHLRCVKWFSNKI